MGDLVVLAFGPSTLEHLLRFPRHIIDDALGCLPCIWIKETDISWLPVTLVLCRWWLLLINRLSWRRP